MKICPTCNKEFPDDVNFCKYDGTPLEEKKVEAGKKCPKCGMTNPASAGFCMACGTKLVAIDEKNVCASCGAELPEGAAFCMKCGAKAGESGERVEEEIDYDNLENLSMYNLEKIETEPHDVCVQIELAIKYLEYCMLSGAGTATDKEEAFDLLQKAAEQGLTEAMYALGQCYEEGCGASVDIRKAIDWYRRAATDAEHPNGIACYHLGVLYKLGKKVPQDYYTAFIWFQKSAELGNDSGMHWLASCYRYGNGCREDLNQARYWDQKAAELGNEFAKKDLAEM
jgi:TPR repeat protein